MSRMNGKKTHTHTHVVQMCNIYIYIIFFHLTYSRWTSSLPSCLWSLRIFPSLPGSRLTTCHRDASSALLQVVNQWLNFSYSRSHAFGYGKKNTDPALTIIQLTTPALLAGVRRFILLYYHITILLYDYIIVKKLKVQNGEVALVQLELNLPIGLEASRTSHWPASVERTNAGNVLVSVLY